jgi:outer membrane lipoprotein-sorting protein
MRRWRAALLAVCGAACGAASSGAAAQAEKPKPAAPDAPAETVDTVLAALDAKGRDLATLEVPFRQARRSAIRKRVVKSSGTLSLKRDVKTGARWMRWHFTAPQERVELIGPTEFRSWNAYLPKERQVVEVRDLREFGIDTENLDVIGRDAASLKKAYTVTLLTVPPKQTDGTPTPNHRHLVRLQLVPRDTRMAKYVAAIEIDMDRRHGLPTRVTTRGPPRPRTGRRNETTFHFDLSKMKRNTPLPADRFTLAPEGVPVKRR